MLRDLIALGQEYSLNKNIPRFGRLLHGNENIAKDVLEYCVFEKHLSNVYGVWRLHSKIIPDWMPKRYCLGIKGSGLEKLKGQ